jgi:hypothetical protein
MGARYNSYFDMHFAWLKYFPTYHLVPVPTPNNKKHVWSPAKIRKVCCVLAAFHVKCVYMNLFGEGARRL